MLGGNASPERVRALFDVRLPLYREADIVVDCGRRTSSAIARHVAELVRAHRPLPA